MKRITTRTELLDLKQELGVRPNWHEPDEQNVTVTMEGGSFDNAGFFPEEACPELSESVREICAIVYKYHDEDREKDPWKNPIAAVNLAMLFAWATGYESSEEEMFERGYKIGYIHGRDEGMNRDSRADALRDAARKLVAEAERIDLEKTS